MTPGQPQPTPAATLTIQCANCSQVIELPMPVPVVINKPTTSLLLFSHEKIPICPKCHQPYMFVLQGLDHEAKLAFAYLALQQPSGIAGSASDADVKTAAENQRRMAEMLKNMKDGTNLIKI